MRAKPPVEDLGDGVWSVPVPIPASPLGYTLVYALESRHGLVLIDAGWEHPESWHALTSGLRDLGHGPSSVYGVIVTHYHPDHAGLAGRVREASGAWIAMHAADAAEVHRFHRLKRAGQRLAWGADALRRAGASETEISEATTGYRPFEPPEPPDRLLADRDLADLPGRELRVIWTPGHTPGHICLHLAGSDRLFTGDHVLPRMTPNIGLYEFERQDTDPLADFLRSLKRVAGIGAREALPAHEHRFTDVGARTAAITEHHERRLGEVETILAGGRAPGTPASGGSDSVTLWELASKMTWKQRWADMPPTLRTLAVGEAAAHLRLLEGRGRARLLPGSGPLRFVATTPVQGLEPAHRYHGPEPHEASA